MYREAVADLVRFNPRHFLPPGARRRWYHRIIGGIEYPAVLLGPAVTVRKTQMPRNELRMVTSKAEREIERIWQLRRDAVRVLGVIVAEFKSDPQSVQCFDLRVVDEAKAVVHELEKLQPKHEIY
jgi:hypothetical protein